jgi:short-subunit dehydrogenase
MLAVVTGASSGIGAEFARKLASRGFDLTLVARREDRLRAIADEVSALPGGVTYGVTKAWMNAFTSGLAVELAAKKSPVRVQALCPGFTLTEFHDVLKTDRSQVPRALWLTSDFVVQESLRAFDRGQTIVIPDWRYKAIARFMRIAPQSWLRRAAQRRNTTK